MSLEVSVVLPSYNRADTLRRAIDSVLRQSFSDWELLVVDDGSTDGTPSLVHGIDPRVRLVRQDHAGCYPARNLGLRESRGRFIAFLDSDDEWLPHFLDLTTAFLRSSPNDHFVTTEFLEDWGASGSARHDALEVSVKYPEMAWRVGSRRLDLPRGETDDYLRIYQSREPLGDWGRRIATAAGYPHALLYRGDIFEHMRWGYLNWLPVTVMTRHALETVGPFVTTCENAADFRFLALLARHFRANMISVPSAIKHDRAAGAELAEAHLATGRNAYRFALNKLGFFDELFYRRRPDDEEVQRIRAVYQLLAARTALRLGDRKAAREHLAEAARGYPGSWDIRTLRVLAAILRFGPRAATIHEWIWRIMRRLRVTLRLAPRAPQSTLKSGTQSLPSARRQR